MQSKKYDYFKLQYDNNAITIETLRKYVEIGFKRPARGITAEEFQEITGVEYDNEQGA